MASRIAALAAHRPTATPLLCRAVLVATACLLSSTALAAPPHYLHAGAMPPGAIGAQKLLSGGPLPGYFQPIEVRGPEGAEVSFVDQGSFAAPQQLPAKAGMLIGSVYRLKVSNIPRHIGEEIFPTVEVIDRLYPPMGQELKFAIPIELAREDIEAAIQGKFVTRIIYLENPRGAYPRAEDPNSQNTFEVGGHEDPLAVADRLGRPMAILRIGGRTPDNAEQPDAAFLYHSPPLLRIVPRSPVAPPSSEEQQPVSSFSMATDSNN